MFIDGEKLLILDVVTRLNRQGVAKSFFQILFPNLLPLGSRLKNVKMGFNCKREMYSICSEVNVIMYL